MANYKNFNTTEDIVGGAAKLKIFPIWSDSPSDADVNQESILTVMSKSVADTSGTTFLWESNYYYNIYGENVANNLNAPVQFSISYGTTYLVPLTHTDEEYQYTYPATAVYSQHISKLANSNIRLFAGNETSTTSSLKYVTSAYFIDISRARLKDSIEIDTWQLTLKTPTGTLNLTNPPTSVQGDYAVPIVSGTISVQDAYPEVYGVLYPASGIFVLDAIKIYQKIGSAAHSFNPSDMTGSTSYAPSGALDNFATMLSSGSYFRARTRENVQTTHYFCRAKNFEFNYSTNPTWVTGSTNEIKDGFYADPKTYITTVGLYDGTGDSGELVAVAKLSRPIPKSADSEALIKVQLSF